MKLGMINSAWEQHGIGLVEGLERTKSLGFDCVDIFQDPLDEGAEDRIRTINSTCEDLQLPIVSVVGVSAGLIPVPYEDEGAGTGLLTPFVASGFATYS